MVGTVGILSVGAGDTKLSFDPNNPADAIRAARVVRDMIRRGYALLVDSGRRDADDRPIYVRAKDFDEKTHEYIIADFDPLVAQEVDENERSNEPTTAPSNGSGVSEKSKRGRQKRVEAAKVSAYAVARTAGG